MRLLRMSVSSRYISRQALRGGRSFPLAGHRCLRSARLYLHRPPCPRHRLAPGRPGGGTRRPAPVLLTPGQRRSPPTGTAPPRPDTTTCLSIQTNRKQSWLSCPCMLVSTVMHRMGASVLRLDLRATRYSRAPSKSPAECQSVPSKFTGHPAASKRCANSWRRCDELSSRIT